VKKKGKDEIEKQYSVDDGHPIHAAQIFAEMLAAACHPEFFDHTDIEVWIPLD
jgi:hypothetical protein